MYHHRNIDLRSYALQKHIARKALTRAALLRGTHGYMGAYKRARVEMSQLIFMAKVLKVIN